MLVAGCGDEGPGGGGGEENDTGAEENDSMNESEDGGVGEEDNESAGEDNESEDETYTITITVEDEMGEPVDDAIVTVDGEGGILSGIFGGDEEEAATDENGEVEAEGLENGEYTVTAEGNDGQTGEETVEVDGSDEEVTVTLGEDGDEGNESDNDTGLGEDDNDSGIGEDDNDTGIGGDNESDNDSGS